MYVWMPSSYLGCAIGFFAVRIFPTFLTRSGLSRFLVTSGENTQINRYIYPSRCHNTKSFFAASAVPNTNANKKKRKLKN